LTDARWDEKIASLPGVSFFHGRAWAQVLYDTYGFQPVYFVRDRGNDINAILPLMEVNSWATGRRGVSLPFTDACEPLGSGAAVSELVAAAMSHARERRWKSCEFRGGRTSLPKAMPSTSFYNHTLDLRVGAPQLLANLDSATRRAVRKAEKSSVTLQFGHDVPAVAAFYRLLCQTRRRLGVPPQPFRFFLNIQRHILAARRGCVVLAHHEGTPIAGAIFFQSGKTALYKFGASDEQYQQLRGNNLVMWAAIEWHVKMGFETLDFGRTSLSNKGLRSYKLSWGATEHALEYAKFDCRRSAFVVEVDRASGWHNKVFSLLPLQISRVAGALLYKHVA
jgi:hypothetical protein